MFSPKTQNIFYLPHLSKASDSLAFLAAPIIPQLVVTPLPQASVPIVVIQLPSDGESGIDNNDADGDEVEVAGGVSCKGW